MVVNCLLVQLPETTVCSWWGRLDKRSQHGRKQSASVSQRQRLEGKQRCFLMSSLTDHLLQFKKKVGPLFRRHKLQIKSQTSNLTVYVHPSLAFSYWGFSVSQRGLMWHRRPKKPEKCKRTGIGLVEHRPGRLASFTVSKI